MDFDDSLMEHAERFWRAECENAERLSVRGSRTMTAIAALFGLGLFRIDWYHAKDAVPRLTSTASATTVKAALTVAVFSFVIALFQTMRSSRLSLLDYVCLLFNSGAKRNDSHAIYGTASEMMALTGNDLLRAPKLSSVESRVLVFKRVYRAAEELRTRNFVRTKRQHRASFFFFVGLIFAAVAVSAFVWA